ncbi:MAG TPA: copper chaperone PCu(A)C [Hyphomicrobiaceae bacterium]|nr:copper chaperone PCu(A)C [Hyphomicrobiaceae bacterium]
MIDSRRLLAIGLTTALLLGPVQAHGVKRGAVEIVHPWTHAGANVGDDAAVYMVVKVAAPKGDRLKGASSPIAGSVELHVLDNVAGTHRTKRVSAFEIGARGRLEMTTTGPRLILKQIKKPLSAFDTFAMTLEFERAGRIEVEVLVEDATMVSPPKH